MPISDIYREKSRNLIALLQNNRAPSEALGKDLLDLIRNGWTNQYPMDHALRPFALSPLIRFFDNSNNPVSYYEIFSQKILSLTTNQNDIDINQFLEDFYTEITVPCQNYYAGTNTNFATANGFYAATFFLMLCCPDKHFVHLRKPKNQISMHLLVRAGIDSNIVQKLANDHLYNLDIYQQLCNWIKNYQEKHNQNRNFIDFMDELEQILTQPPPEVIGVNVNMSNLNTILYGPPGTGKTFNTINKALEVIDSSILKKEPNEQDKGYRNRLKNIFDEFVNKNQIRFVTFHQSYSYEEFVEGIRAETSKDQNNDKIHYFVKPGIFKQICEKAQNDSGNNYVLIIDEINRGNISKIFGELITLIEDSKRTIVTGSDEASDEALIVTLPYSNKPFSVPNNLYIIGTMNTADRSLALMDTALRRRFDFVEMMPKPELLKNVKEIITEKRVDGQDIKVPVDIQLMLESMNQRIEVLYDREHTLGHAFFMPLIDQPTIENLARIFKNKIIPLLQEYFFEDWDKIRIVLGDDNNKTEENQFVRENSNNLARFSETVKAKYRLNNVNSYSLNNAALSNPQAYIGIYQ
jgi:5-methylcytosine-specific restriction endonuclease McrBC GTP-binding regulatory subunit McrB